VRGVATVLIVEDEFAIADLLEMVLTDEGYRVLLAANGRQTLVGVVRLAGPGRAWQPPDHDEFAQSLPWLPLSSRDHRAGYLALSLLQPEPARICQNSRQAG
jgi:hypothetical protein